MQRIKRIELPTIYGMGTVNCYLIMGDCPTLIDCGEDTDESWAALVHGITEEGLKINDIQKLVITHAHVDHIGMAQRVSVNCNCEVWVSDIVKPWALHVEDLWAERALIMQKTFGSFLSAEFSSGILGMFKEMGKKMMNQWKVIDEDRLQIFHHSEGSISIGDERWKIIYAPGHSITQSCFYLESTKQLISADMLLKMTPTPVIEVDTDNSTNRSKSIVTLLESYKKFREIEMSSVYPGHYEVFKDPYIKIDAQVNRIHHRKDECLQLIQSGSSNLMALFQTMYKGKWYLPAFNMTLSYLDLLEHEEKIQFVYRENLPLEIIPN